MLFLLKCSSSHRCILQNKEAAPSPCVCKQTPPSRISYLCTVRSSRPSGRAKAAIREMNKLAREVFSFFLLSAQNTAAHSIRIKLAIAAILADLLATQQLPQRLSGDVHKNEMGLCKAIKKGGEKNPYIKVNAAPQRLPSPDSTEGKCILLFVQTSTAVMMNLIITEGIQGTLRGRRLASAAALCL